MAVLDLTNIITPFRYNFCTYILLVLFYILMLTFLFIYLFISNICIYNSMVSCVVLGINSMSNAESNFHEAKPSEISCITSAINP